MSKIDLLVLSPHLDDAALSCGGLIHREASRGRRILVVTIFTGDVPGGPLSELASWVLRVMKLDRENGMALRRLEDERACAMLGADWIHWPFLETPYRVDPAGQAIYASLSELFGLPKPADDPLADALVEKLRQLPPAGRVLAPLTVGSHVDHHLTRRAAEAVHGGRLEYYEDFPYVRKFLALRKTLGRRRDWLDRIESVDSADLAAKIEAVDAYVSQVEPLFGGSAKMARAIRWRRFWVGGERFWRHAEAPVS